MASAAATGAVLFLGAPSLAGARLLALVTAIAGFAGVLVLEARGHGLDRRPVLVGSAVLLALAVAAPPQGSRDVWSYATCGRIVAHYHHRPYRRAADDFPDDPIARLVSPAWRHAPSVYGPAFVALAAAGSWIAGSSPTANRLFFQGLDAAAILGVLALLARRGAAAGALAFVGLNPVVVTVVVNGGHNDALVGAALLAGVLLAARRPWIAGLVLGLAALIKIVALLALAAVAVWLWRAHSRRAAAAVAAAGGVAVVVGYALAGGLSALRPVVADRGFHSRASIWTAVRGLGPTLRSPTLIEASLALALVVVIGGRSRHPLPVATGAALAAYLVAAPYVLPWYGAWALPVLALAWKSRLAAVICAYECALAVAFVTPPTLDPDVLRGALTVVSVVVLPLMAAAILAYIIRLSWRAPRLPGTAPPAITFRRGRLGHERLTERQSGIR